jgi:hypothetical protein
MAQIQVAPIRQNHRPAQVVPEDSADHHQHPTTNSDQELVHNADAAVNPPPGVSVPRCCGEADYMRWCRRAGGVAVTAELALVPSKRAIRRLDGVSDGERRQVSVRSRS